MQRQRAKPKAEKAGAEQADHRKRGAPRPCTLQQIGQKWRNAQCEQWQRRHDVDVAFALGKRKEHDDENYPGQRQQRKRASCSRRRSRQRGSTPGSVSVSGSQPVRITPR